MDTLCLSPVPFPVCVQAASILTTTVFVKKVNDHRMCYYPEAIDGCTMPTDLTINNGFYPVVANATGEFSVHGEIVLDSTYDQDVFTMPNSAKTLYIKDNTDVDILVESKNATICAFDPLNIPTVGTITVLQGNVHIKNLHVKQINFPEGIIPGKILLVNISIVDPIQVAPEDNTVDISMDGAVFDNVRGNYVALLHHSGTVNSTNTDILWLPRATGDDSHDVLSYGNGSNLNVAKLTGIFGAQYQIEQAAGSVVVENLQAEQIATALLFPTLLLVGITVFSNIDRLSSRNVDQEGNGAA